MMWCRIWKTVLIFSLFWYRLAAVDETTEDPNVPAPSRSQEVSDDFGSLRESDRFDKAPIIVCVIQCDNSRHERSGSGKPCGTYTTVSRVVGS
jgi:hypothetical protein